MSDSLIIADAVELLGGGPASTNPLCPGAEFHLADPFDFGAPQPTSDVVASMILDGEKSSGRRASNRTITLPIVIQAPNRQILDAAREYLMQVIDADQFVMRWTPDPGTGTALPLLFDCQRASATVINYSITINRQLVSQLTISFSAAPYGRSDTQQVIDFPSPIAGFPAPPSPITIDSYSTVTGTNWTQSLIGPGPDSAHWAPPAAHYDGATAGGAAYARTGIGPFNLAQGWSFPNAGTPLTPNYFIVSTGQAAAIDVGDQFQIWNPAGSALVYSTIFTVTALSAPAAGFVNVSYSGNSLAVIPSTNLVIQTGPPNLYALSVFAGFGTTRYARLIRAFSQPVIFTFSLTDGTTTISFSQTVQKVSSGSSAATPVWRQLSVRIPYVPGFNYHAVTGYTLKASNRANGDLLYADAYFDSLTAVPAPVSLLPPQRGFVTRLNGIQGSARAPASWQFQQTGTSVLVTKTFTTPGVVNWVCPPGVTSYSGFSIGAGGDAAPFFADGGGGGAGGSSAKDAAVAVTAGIAYPMTVGARGSGGGAGGASSFTGDSVTRSAPGGGGTTTASGGAAGAAGFGGFAGGAGGAGVNTTVGGGGAGGSSGGTASAGNVGGAASGGTGGTPGASVAGGGIGGRGGTFGIGNGSAPVAGYGGGAGGSPGGGFGRRDYGGFTDGFVQISFLQPPSMTNLIAHRPSFDAPYSLSPYVSLPITDVPDGTTEYPVLSLVSGIPARFDGTYTIVAVNLSWNAPTTSRTLTATVRQYEQAGGTMVSSSTPVKTFIPNTDPDVAPNGIVVLGEITLPAKKVPAENVNAQFTITLTDSNTADRFYDILILDTMGQTVIINGTTSYANFFIDEPADSDVGLIMGSVSDRDMAVSVTDQCLNIQPLGVDPSGCQTLLVYSTQGAPAVQLMHWPRWRGGRYA